MINYRRANQSDISTLAEMRLMMLCEHTDCSKELKNLIRNNTVRYFINCLAEESLVIWVAFQEENIVSMCCINFFSLPPNDWCPSGKTAYIGNMFTTPQYRNQGIASGLLELIIDEAKKHNCERILLNTTEEGKSLYERYGFELSPTAMALYPFGIIPSV